jgi:pimeloyl-ACP methyl ester carboxylesterase
LLVAAGYQCITPDSIGHGKSSNPTDPQRFSLDERALDVLAVADTAGVDQFAFLGYSMGAWIGSGLMARHPRRVRATLLAGWDPVCGAALFTRATDPITRRAEIAKVVEFLCRARHEPLPPPERLGSIALCYEELFRPIPTLDALAAVPVRFFCGERDPYFANVRSAAAALSARVFSCDADHVGAATSLEFVAAVFDWLRTDWPTHSHSR